MTREQAWKSFSVSGNKINSDLANKIVEKVYGDEYKFLAQDVLSRISEITKYYSYYDLDGQRWSPPRSIGYRPTVMPINLARWFVDKRTGWMFENAPDIECPPKVIDEIDDIQQGYVPSKAQKVADNRAAAKEQFLYSVWGDNKFEEKLIEAGKDYYIGGTVALKIRYLPETGICLNFSPCNTVFPIPNDSNPDVLDAVHFASFYHNDNMVWHQSWEMIDGRCFLTEGIYDLDLRLIEAKYDRVDTKLDFIPVIIFPRNRLSNEGPFGRSYLKDLIPLFDQYNRTMSDAADSLRFNLFAVTVLLNAVPDAEQNLTVSPGAIWNIAGEGIDVKKLESGFEYSKALADFLTRLENLMHLIGDVPDITPDRIKGFGLVSGVALKLLYSDLVSATNQDWRIWKSRLAQTNEYILRMAKIFGVFNSYGDYTNRIIPHLPLPEDEALKVQIEIQKLKSSMQSLKGALQEIGEKNPDRKIAEIIAESDLLMRHGVKESIEIGEEEIAKPKSTSV